MNLFSLMSSFSEDEINKRLEELIDQIAEKVVQKLGELKHGKIE